MNKFSYYITTNFIPSNKNYNSCCNSYLVYQTYLKCSKKLKKYSILAKLVITVINKLAGEWGPFWTEPTRF